MIEADPEGFPGRPRARLARWLTSPVPILYGLILPGLILYG
jgi:hypothetical protein